MASTSNSDGLTPPLTNSSSGADAAPFAASLCFTDHSLQAMFSSKIHLCLLEVANVSIFVCFRSMGIYITRWSAKQLCEIANTIKGEKGDVISKSSFMDLLHISPLRPPSEALVDFIVMRIATKKRLLKLNDQKKIPLTRAMVKKIFNVPSRSKPLQFGKRGKADFHEIYLEGERAPIPTTVSILSNDVDDDEDTMESSPPLHRTQQPSLSYIDQLAHLPNKASVTEEPPEINNQGGAGVSATLIPDVDSADDAQEPIEGGMNDADGTSRNVHEPPPKNTEGGNDVCGSLEDWLHPLPTFEELEFWAEACVDETREEAVVEVSSGRGHDQKNPTLKRDPPTEPTAAKLPKMKKIKIDEMDDGIYQRFDCGIFAILYMGNLTAKGLNPFNTDTTSLLNFWKYIAAKLFKHPQNTLILEEELEKLLKKS
ncbi:hypothetical protein ZWY2020_020726 [Hordeum vulgare]|nr:hypothetical protein ZWY2020_020726 [Hordeum vulgare]